MNHVGWASRKLGHVRLKRVQYYLLHTGVLGTSDALQQHLQLLMHSKLQLQKYPYCPKLCCFFYEQVITDLRALHIRNKA